MFHALGITHVVSVVECALVPPHVNYLVGSAQEGGPGGPGGPRICVSATFAFRIDEPA